MYHGLSSFAIGSKNIQSSDFMMDFNMGELCFSDVLISSYLPARMKLELGVRGWFYCWLCTVISTFNFTT